MVRWEEVAEIVCWSGGAVVLVMGGVKTQTAKVVDVGISSASVKRAKVQQRDPQ